MLFRSIALTFGTLLFVSAVLLTLSTFLPLFTLHRASHWFFVPGTLLYETYAFSSLLVPLLLLHTALLLFVGGRSLRAESALVAFPLLFITAVCGEHGLYALRRALAARSISPSTRGGIDIVCVLCLLALLGAELYAALIYGERCYVWFHARIPRDFIADGFQDPSFPPSTADHPDTVSPPPAPSCATADVQTPEASAPPEGQFSTEVPLQGGEFLISEAEVQPATQVAACGGVSTPTALAPSVPSQAPFPLLPAPGLIQSNLPSDVHAPASPGSLPSVIPAQAPCVMALSPISAPSVAPAETLIPAQDDEQGPPRPIPASAAPLRHPCRGYQVPYDLLDQYSEDTYEGIDELTKNLALLLEETFSEFNIRVEITGIKKGPVVTMFELLPPPGIKLSKITNLQDNVALKLAASSVRIVAPIPGKHAIGVEVPNKKRSLVTFKELLHTRTAGSNRMAIPVILGKDVTGEPQVIDLAQTPHLLIAGATGSGKSVCVNALILSILYHKCPDETKLLLIDPKIVELKLYNDIAHLLTPVITEPKRALQALQYILCEMERRYALLEQLECRDIKTYNKKIQEKSIATQPLPFIVIIIDEFADLMVASGKELETSVARLCAMSRAVGIHLVLATQRPSIDVITGLIKANIPSRIAFMVSSKMDSRIILDEMGAEKLLGRGDMLYMNPSQSFPTRIQGAYVSERELARVIAHVRAWGTPEYLDEEIFFDDDDASISGNFVDESDPLYEQAVQVVQYAGKASTSYVQRKLKIGYNRAARLIEEMEARGVVGPPNGSKPRDVLRS